jgi:hypothetical protein
MRRSAVAFDCWGRELIRSLGARSTAGFVVVTLGEAELERDAQWKSIGAIDSVVRLQSVAPLGYRFGNRLTGLGYDAARVALRAYRQNGRGRYLATGPWVGVAMASFAPAELVVMGLFAEPGSRQFRVLRRVIGDSLVLAAAEIEAETWRAAGGRAEVALYGNTFGYECRTASHQSGRLKVFVGGSSDRSRQQVAALIEQLSKSGIRAELTIVDLHPPSVEELGSLVIRRTGRISPEAFGEELRANDVAFIPVSPFATRGAGHMVTVGALEAGVPVVATQSPAMQDFFDGEFVRPANTDLVDQLVSVRSQLPPSAASRIRAHWSDNYALPKYFERIGSHLKG